MMRVLVVQFPERLLETIVALADLIIRVMMMVSQSIELSYVLVLRESIQKRNHENLIRRH